MWKKKNKTAAACLSLASAEVCLMLGGCGGMGAPKGYTDYTVEKQQYVDEYTEQYDYWDVITIEYPVLSGIEGEQIEEINKTLYDTAMEMANYWHFTPDETVKEIQEEYSIYCSDVSCDVDFHSQYLISVGFHEAYAPISPVYYTRMTRRSVTINLMTGEQYRLADIFRIDDDFMSLWCAQVEEDGMYDDLVVNDEDTRDTFRAWFLGEDEESAEYYMFTPFFYIDENKDFVIGISYDPKPSAFGAGTPKDNTFYAHFAVADLEAYRTESEFWELYDKSENTGEVVDCELTENIWLGEDASVWDFWEEREW